MTALLRPADLMHNPLLMLTSSHGQPRRTRVPATIPSSARRSGSVSERNCVRQATRSSCDRNFVAPSAQHGRPGHTDIQVGNIARAYTLAAASPETLLLLLPMLREAASRGLRS